VIPHQSQHIAASLRTEYYSPGELDVALAEDCARFYDNPYGFVLWAFDWGHGELANQDGPDIWQRDILVEVGEMVRANAFDGFTPVDPIREAVASGHGIGKSALVAWVILWIMATRPFCRGTVTANTADQLQSKTWGELAKWKQRCIVGAWFELNSGKGSLSMYHRAWPERWLVKASTCREENSEAFAGQHAADSTSFYIFDEASAVPDKIWEVAEGGLTDGEPMFFAFGNPTRNTGQFKKCFAASSRWRSRSIDSRTAKMTNKKQIAQWAEDWGIDSDFFRVRVLGRFPSASDMQFMPGDVVANAMRRPLGQYLGTDPLIMGIDIARGGADNCRIQFRRGYDARSEKSYVIPGEKARDSMKVVAIITLLIERHQPDTIFVDETGIGGPIVDRLRQLGHPVFGVHFGGDAEDKSHYRNKTAEMGARCREWLMNGGTIQDDAQLEEELTVREFWHNEKDQLVLEPKPDLKVRLGVSPDWADALYLTFAMKVPPLRQPRGFRDAAPHARQNLTNAAHDYDPLAQSGNYYRQNRVKDYDPLENM
jgi:hypothetical protein